MLKKSLLALVIGLFTLGAFAAERATIAFYNVENMFDHLDDPHTNDSEYTPTGANRWTEAKSLKKISNIAEVIQKMSLPDIVGLAEVENAYVVNKLITDSKLINAEYAYVHYDSPDERGIDVALIYRQNSFQVISSRAVPVDISQYSKRPTRDILHVEGSLHGEKIHILVNHWPSRSGGQAATNPHRAEAAKTAKRISDEITAADSNAKIILMGDLNDNPTDTSLVRHLGAKNIKTSLIANDLFNPFYNQYKKGIGSNAFQDVWSNFDQVLVSNNLLKISGWKFSQNQVFNKSFLIQQSGRYKGYPLRTNNETGSIGYSDHFPALVTLER